MLVKLFRLNKNCFLSGTKRELRMRQLIYISEANHPMSSESLLTILKSSRVFNKSVGITGILLYRNNTFIQLLEGDKENIDKLYEKIQKDDRHKNCFVILEQDTEERSFPNWSMGFEDLSNDEAYKELGFNDFFNSNQSHKESEVLELISNFKEYT